MKIRTLINGANGKMGKLAQETLSESEKVEIVALTGRGDELASAIKDNDVEVALDFTLASVAFENAQVMIENGATPLIGTSGLSSENCDRLAALCAEKSIGGLIVPNFSLTATLMMRYAQDAAKYLKNVEIVEYHHERKEEAPSGTGVRTAEMIAELKLPERERGHEVSSGALGANIQNVPIHSIRLPGYIARQEVIFGDAGELLVLRSEATTRDCFKQGIRLACERVRELDTLKIGLETIL